MSLGEVCTHSHRPRYAAKKARDMARDEFLSFARGHATNTSRVCAACTRAGGEKRAASGVRRASSSARAGGSAPAGLATSDDAAGALLRALRATRRGPCLRRRAAPHRESPRREQAVRWAGGAHHVQGSPCSTSVGPALGPATIAARKHRRRLPAQRCSTAVHRMGRPEERQVGGNPAGCSARKRVENSAGPRAHAWRFGGWIAAPRFNLAAKPD